MDKFNIYLFVINFWNYLFTTNYLDISKIKIVYDENITEDHEILSDYEN
jgi:hypothetical protein